MGRWLSGGGAVAALVVGAATIWGLGWRGCAVLLAFFITSSLLTETADIQRTAKQVLANGGAAAIAALAGSWPAFAGALAAANADTWATEIGRRSRTPPRLLFAGATVPPGTSGGMTALGTAGGLAGAALIAGVAALVGPNQTWAAVAAAGVGGMLLDSLLGATLQGSERGVRLNRGYAWLDNDAVNLAATCAGAVLAWSAAR